tara:strand:- start:9672 stop:10304 length:633 start_codon:yes stop_codon:yes gene_type:complete
MGRASKGEERRAQIILALQDVMAEKGYERASIKSIAQAASINPGLVHHYFGNKQEILVSLVEDLGQRLHTRYIQQIEESEDAPRARLFAFIDAYVGLGPGADPKAVACWVSIGAEAIRQPEVRETFMRFMRDTLEQIKLRLTEVLADEGRQITNIEALASVLLASIEGSYTLAMAVPGLTPQGYASPTLKQMIVGLIEQQPLREGKESST